MNQSIGKGGQFSYLFGLICFVLVFFVSVVLWYIFMHADGIIKLYTPMYGFSLVAMLLCSIVLICNVWNYYPFSVTASTSTARLGRGIVLTVESVLLTLLITYGVFWHFLGKYAVAYFSPESIIVSGGSGAEPFVARENASTAIIYVGAAFLWLALTWDLGFGSWPWQENSRGVIAWSKTLVVLLFTVLAYAVLFHPHVCHLFYPAQNKAGVEPWWASFAGTGSAFFSLGLLLCTVGWITISRILWEGYPWKFFARNEEGSFIKGLVASIGCIILGGITFVLLLKVMNIYWMEPFEGGQYTDAPYFRYLHTGEISGFVILATFILSTYFNNFPNTGSTFINAIVRTVIAMLGGFAFYLFYYSAASTLLLGKVPGIGQPDDTPLVWTILYLAIVMIHCEFFESWPLAKKEKG
ncbi:MAG: amino acid transporter, family [Thermodesulfobacteriota bacterium]|nr:amino acid transporter, family [Thermodesulfobacteriota bacterium]